MKDDAGSDRSPTRIASLLAYRTDSVEAFGEWLEERAERLRKVRDVRDLEVVVTGDPPLAGIVTYFDTGEAYERYCHEHLAELRESIETSSWLVSGPVRQVLEREPVR